MKTETRKPLANGTAFTETSGEGGRAFAPSPLVENQAVVSSGDLSESVVERDGELYHVIENVDRMPEFFMSLTSSSDHWMFVSSRGALSAGRCDPNGALFPYYSSDKISDLRHVTGPVTMFRIDESGESGIWEPFSSDTGPSASVARNLFKNPVSNKLIFEEVNFELGLAFQYRWTFSHRFGFVRSGKISHFGDQPRVVQLLDGLRNILPPVVGQEFQLRYSNLADAYKRSELVDRTRLGIYYLNSIPTDCAEPSEGLRANVVWQSGLESPQVLLCERQIPAFRAGATLETEREIRGRRGCYLLADEIRLEPGQECSWDIVAGLDHDQTDVINLNEQLVDTDQAIAAVREDIARGQLKLEQIISSSDGKQVGGNLRRVHRHQSNVLFNVMRGGVPAAGYEIDRRDFLNHLKNFNSTVFSRFREGIEALPERFSIAQFRSTLDRLGDLDLIRLGMEYLPLTFSRRHGDPTRPWNFFSISTEDPDGTQRLDYQGNWRDIFQNWEALSISFPRFTESLVIRFLNASTVDGYNPYRLTKDGFEWETPDPDDPWSNIGYWGDHQIIYLLKLLEWSRRFSPDVLDAWLNKPVCTYARIPYRIRSYQQILENPQATIDFDDDLNSEIERRCREIGADGKLLRHSGGDVCRATVLEKLLVPLLAKFSNFVPGGGIWLNTQRPEWNDANNALVGNGLSVVTVFYMRRYLAFLNQWMRKTSQVDFELSTEVNRLFGSIGGVLREFAPAFGEKSISDSVRKAIVDRLSEAGSAYRESVYASSLSGETTTLAKVDLVAFLEHGIAAIEQTVRLNRREDGLYHSYNLLGFHRGAEEPDAGFGVEHLYLMLEGQVAALSSGQLSPTESVELLDALRASSLYRADQDSYLLYPNRELPRFMDKNRISEEQVARSNLLQHLLQRGDPSLIRADLNGETHFAGNLRNAGDVKDCLEVLAKDAGLKGLVEDEAASIQELFEQVFDHRRFTGRSGTFFGYEGLGSIYWHMVSKLVLAIGENVLTAKELKADTDTVARMVRHYRKVRDGIAGSKTPEQWGAFVTDPYSHTPAGAGAKQPGMTGQVKEDILSRFIELGVCIEYGQLSFDDSMIDSDEWTDRATQLEFTNSAGEKKGIPVSAGAIAFTLCQTPVIYMRSNQGAFVRIVGRGDTVERPENCLSVSETGRLFDRDGSIERIEVGFAVSDVQ